MPRDNISWLDHEDILNYDEITRLSNIFTVFGVNRIRITGGEPLIRPGIHDLISSLSKNNSIKTISMTTNGLLLSNKLNELKKVSILVWTHLDQIASRQSLE